ncbi:MAG: M23 family metallopeptidase [Gemmatimonadetes bacterium]|nr:M23 family metallopeptidase [Gemmatimonadota bacterium]
MIRNQGLRNEYLHQGVDIEAASGTKVYALFDGRVTQVVDPADGNGAGIRVTIRSKADATENTSYWHLSSVYVSVGDQVRGGERIGRSGITGNADPANSGRREHVHIRRTKDGRDVDPGIP